MERNGDTEPSTADVLSAVAIEAFLDWLLDEFRPNGAVDPARVWIAAWRTDTDGREYLTAVRETRREIIAAYGARDRRRRERVAVVDLTDT